MRNLIAITIALTSGAAFAATNPCPATPACSSLPNVVVVQAGDTQQNLLQRLGRVLRDNTAMPVTLVFSTSGSCVNIDNFYNHDGPFGGTTASTMQYIPSTADEPIWDITLNTCSCTIPAGSNVFPDIGNSALFISSCTTATPPTTVHFTDGPIQAYVMAVPRASDQIAITFEEAYFVFGFGTPGMITPWIDETQMFIRTITKSTLLTWAANIAVPGNKWHGMMFDKSGQVVTALQGSVSPEAAIGILGAEVYDADRSFLKELAFRSKDQYAAYFADSTSTSRDKQNVRDGHYTVWSPTVWMDNIDGSGNPVNANARYVVDLIAGHDVMPIPNFDAQTIVAQVGLVPDCAMRVQRAQGFDGSPLSLYKPTHSCTCKYLADVDSPPCSTCDSTHPCTAGGVCRNGYCEEF
jgi:hypothetical protein